MKDTKLLVDNCPLCRIFTHKEIKTKLYWPEFIDEVPESEFVIVNCEIEKKPLIILGEHIDSVHKEQWGRMLRICRMIFGKNVRLDLHMVLLTDHWHAYINVKEY